jgi:asparagine synthase (glutamine-hydrolysing)
LSAIFGIIDLNNKEISDRISSRMLDKYNNYSLDNIKVVKDSHLYFGCGIQYITPESKQEILPGKNKAKNFLLTADAIIDNRAELSELLNISKEHSLVVTDSELIMMSYEKWGKASPKYLIGDFAFAIWDIEKKELFCARDCIGTRTLYYYISDKQFAFSTLMKPLFTVFDKDIELNERWITDFLALKGVIQETDCEETVYKDIFQLSPATTLTFSERGIEKEEYWNPLKDIKPLALASDKEYDKQFIKVLKEAVSCRLRSNGQVGIMLSGGLDSGSVASIGADLLSNEGRDLKAYSSVPFDGYQDKLPEYFITDETEFVNELRNKYKNIDLTYCQSQGKNSVTNIDELVEMFEQPYKIIENLYWIDEIIDKSSKDGCKVLLNGQYGNCTISYGKFFTHTLTLFRAHRFKTLAREIKHFSRLNHVSPMIVAKDVARTMVPFKLRKTIGTVKYRKNNSYSKIAANPELIEKWDVKRRFAKKNFNQDIQRFCDLDEMREFIVNPAAFSHIGAIDTKISLTHGVMRRDPTKDKRVIEFCLSLPSDQFVRNGCERFLIRRAMRGILPDKIRLNTMKRGLQSADKLQRLMPKWEQIYRELELAIEDEDISKYIDKEKLKKELPSIKTISDESDWNIIRMFIIVLILSHFIKGFKKNDQYLNLLYSEMIFA